MSITLSAGHVIETEPYEYLAASTSFLASLPKESEAEMLNCAGIMEKPANGEKFWPPTDQSNSEWGKKPPRFRASNHCNALSPF